MPVGIGKTNRAKHVILVKEGAKPVRQKIYRRSPASLQAMHKIVDQIVIDNVIEPCKASEWCSQPVMAKHPNGKYRMCIDFCDVNVYTERATYRSPHMIETLESKSEAYYNTTFDFNSAYWQAGLSEESRKYATFWVSSRGLFIFKRMPMGLINANARF